MRRRLARGILVLSALALALPPTSASAETPRQANPVSLCSAGDPTLCLQPGPPAPLTVLGKYQNTARFKWDRRADGSYANRAIRNRCLDLMRGTVATRTEVCDRPTFPRDSNEWDIFPGRTIRNRHNDLCLSVNQRAVQEGNFTVVRRCDPKRYPDQRWVITTR